MPQITVGTHCYAVADTAADTLMTSGLGNCVGVVGFDPTTKKAALVHLDTVNCAKIRHGATVIDTKALKTVKELLEDVADAKEFRVVLGTMWGTTLWAKGEKYVSSDIKSIFNHAPIGIASAMTFRWNGDVGEVTASSIGAASTGGIKLSIGKLATTPDSKEKFVDPDGNDDNDSTWFDFNSEAAKAALSKAP